MRYTGKGVYNRSFIACSAGCPSNNNRTIDNNNIDSNTSFGISLAYKPFDNKDTNVFLAVDNVFDTNPPIIGGNTINAYYLGQSNTDYWDRTGRTVRAGLRVNL